MPFDKANNNNASRPLKPVLATNRNVKSPITPRLAASATPPLTRKTTQSDIASAFEKSASKESISTPVQAFLNNNITPRSSSRKSRVDSAQSTPEGGTPRITRPNSAAGNGHGNRNIAIQGGGGQAFMTASKSKPKSVVGSPSTGNSPLIRSSAFITTGLQSSEPPADRDIESKFFRANEARSPVLLPVPKKAAAFFYANGQQEESSGRPTVVPSPPLSAVSARSGRSQFFHANGAEVDDIPPLSPPPYVSPSPKPLPVEVLQRAPAFFRPPSSENIHLSYRKGASQVIKPSNRANALPLLSPPNLQIPTTIPTTAPTARRRSGSAETPGVQQGTKSHNRTSSLGSIESPPSSRKSSTAADNANYSGLSPLATTWQAASTSSGGSGTSTPSRHSGGAAGSPNPTRSTPQAPRSHNTTPDKPTACAPQLHAAAPAAQPPQPQPSQPPQPSQLAADARRERKVLDLEISNSSLLAINRQLEREVRKQKAELRRFRRLTRAGRFSDAAVLRGPEAGRGGEEGGEGEAEVGGDEEDGEEFEEGEEDDDDDEGEDSTDDSSLSSAAVAERDERMLAKDSKRLQLDLSRHRELLVDSQKMNQALRRCMAWTEEMILEGKKALEYRVRVDEVKLGGRVLDREVDGGEEEEVDGEAEEQHRLVSAWSPTSVPHLEASRDGILGLGIIRSGSWQSDSITSPSDEAADIIADLLASGEAEVEPIV